MFFNGNTKALGRMGRDMKKLHPDHQNVPLSRVPNSINVLRTFFHFAKLNLLLHNSGDVIVEWSGRETKPHCCHLLQE